MPRHHMTVMAHSLSGAEVVGTVGDLTAGELAIHVERQVAAHERHRLRTKVVREGLHTTVHVYPTALWAVSSLLGVKPRR